MVERTQVRYDGLSRLRVCVSFACVAAALVAGGCGENSSSTARTGQSSSLNHAGSTGSIASSRPPSSGDPPSRSQLIARADVICGRLNTKFAAGKATGVGMREIARFAPPHAALEWTALAELSKLAPPPSIARDWRQMIAYRRTLAEELVELGQDAKANDAAAIKALTASKKRVHGELLTTATRAGFKDCSRVG
jgi:hypothetical protein